MKQIELTQGKYALVDDCDYEYLMQWKWCAIKGHKTFYAQRNEKINGKQTTTLMHRVIAERRGLYMGGDIHHKDDNGLNNQIWNLFGLTRKQHREIAGLSSANTSGVKGVSQRKSGKYQAYIYHNGKFIHLGNFDKLKDAKEARLAGERKYFTHG